MRIKLEAYENSYLEIVKIREYCECIKCRNRIPKGSYCFRRTAHSYFKYCLNCAVIYMENCITNNIELIRRLRHTISLINRNKAKFDNINMCASLGEGN
jgi:hypothetical protein